VPGAGAAEAGHRARICRFFDERTTAAGKLRFVHGLMREGDIGAYLKRMESLWASFSAAERQDSAFTEALAQLSADDATRARFLTFARAAARPAQRARMIDLASSFGWLDARQRAHEELALVNDVLAGRTLGFAEVDLICGLGAEGRLAAAASELRAPAAATMRVGHSAALACLGDAEAHQRTLRALVSSDEGDARIAQAYLRHRPIREATELRPVARAVAQMPGSIAKVRALDALARLRISDQEVLQELTRSFAEARSASVQNAIAEIFLRSDYRSPDLAGVLREHRLTAAGKGELVDVLLGRLGSASAR